jgi:hypothetical protein
MNKRLISVFLLIVFAIAWLKPSIPFISYELNKYYIQKYLCEQKEKPNNSCKGKCHLRKQIKKINERDNNQDLPILPKVSFDDYPVFDILVSKGSSLAAIFQKRCFVNFNFYNFLFSMFIFHPPKSNIKII